MQTSVKEISWESYLSLLPRMVSPAWFTVEVFERGGIPRTPLPDVYRHPPIRNLVAAKFPCPLRRLRCKYCLWINEFENLL